MEKLSNSGAKLTYYRDGPAWDGRRAAAVGQFSCKAAEDGALLLAETMTQAMADGAEAVIGPMDGDTWHGYRLVEDTDGSKPFLMEPNTKPEALEAFRLAGFDPISRYFSARVALSDLGDLGADSPAGLQVEAWDGNDAEALFAQVHALSCVAFSGNPFYKPIDLDEFLAMYMPIVPLLKQDLILFARSDEGAMAGFLFGIPNYAEGPAPEAAILKTYASLQKGAGHALSTQFYRAARNMGFQTAVHALMHDDNLSATRSAMNGADVFRRYVLMGRRLEQ